MNVVGGVSTDQGRASFAAYQAGVTAWEAQYEGMTGRERSRAQLVRQLGEELARERFPHWFN
jgi:hypothetical protein